MQDLHNYTVREHTPRWSRKAVAATRNMPALPTVPTHNATLHVSAQFDPTQERTANCRPGIRALACAAWRLPNASGSVFGFWHTPKGLTHMTGSPAERRCSRRLSHLGTGVAQVGPGMQAMPAALLCPWSALPQREYQFSAQTPPLICGYTCRPKPPFRLSRLHPLSAYPLAPPPLPRPSELPISGSGTANKCL